jgi:flagellar hook-associated protein 1
MGIYSALNIGQTALAASQTALSVVGNNIANANTPNYSRQDIHLVPVPGVRSGMSVGKGVQVSQILRRYDAAVESRLRSALSDATSRLVQQQTLDRLEGLYNELTDNDLSTALTGLFNSFSDLATNPQDLAVRTIVMEKAQATADMIVRLRQGMDSIRTELNGGIKATVEEINRLSAEIGRLNIQITESEQGKQGTAPGLRDERDAKLRDLSQLIDIRVVPQANGTINVVVGNQTLVDSQYVRKIGLESIEDHGLGVWRVRFDDNRESVAILGGLLQGQVVSRDELITTQVRYLDEVARALIFEVNRLHSEGIGISQPQRIRSNLSILDRTAPLTSPDAGLAWTPQHGSFLIHTTNTVSGLTETTVISVNLDGTMDDSLESLAARIDSVENIRAYIDASGYLVIEGATVEYRVSFTEDSSEILAALGVNGIFTGHDSNTIGVSSELMRNPWRLAAGLTDRPGDSDNALRMAQLADAPLKSLGGALLLDYHKQGTTRLAVNTAAARSARTASEAFVATMIDQRESISGVNLDEEAVNLIRYQKAFAAAAKFMSAMSELLDQIMAI